MFVQLVVVVDPPLGIVVVDPPLPTPDNLPLILLSLWKYKGLFGAVVIRSLAVVCAALSLVIIWCEITIAVPVDLSPIGFMVQASRGPLTATVSLRFLK